MHAQISLERFTSHCISNEVSRTIIAPRYLATVNESWLIISLLLFLLLYLSGIITHISLQPAVNIYKQCDLKERNQITFPKYFNNKKRGRSVTDSPRTGAILLLRLPCSIFSKYRYLVHKKSFIFWVALHVHSTVGLISQTHD